MLVTLLFVMEPKLFISIADISGRFISVLITKLYIKNIDINYALLNLLMKLEYIESTRIRGDTYIMLSESGRKSVEVE